jgi:hypothetical protein
MPLSAGCAPHVWGSMVRPGLRRSGIEPAARRCWQAFDTMECGSPNANIDEVTERSSSSLKLLVPFVIVA